MYVCVCVSDIDLFFPSFLVHLWFTQFWVRGKLDNLCTTSEKELPCMETVLDMTRCCSKWCHTKTDHSISKSEEKSFSSLSLSNCGATFILLMRHCIEGGAQG